MQICSCTHQKSIEEQRARTKHLEHRPKAPFGRPTGQWQKRAYFPTAASSSGGRGSLMAAAGNSEEEEGRGRAPRQHVVSSSFQWHCKMGQLRKDTLLFRLLFPFCFLRGSGGPSHEQSRFFRCWLLQNKASLLSELIILLSKGLEQLAGSPH